MGDRKLIIFRPFKIEDAEQVCKESMDDTAIRQITFWKTHEKLITESGIAQSGYLDGQLVCVAGMVFTEKGQGELWAVFSQKLIAKKKTLLRSLRTVLFDFVIPVNDIKRITVLTRKGFVQSQTLLKHLGFNPCKIIHKNYYLYERLM